MILAADPIFELTLPYPDTVLSPNSPKRHWRAKQPAKETARSHAYYLAKACRISFAQDDVFRMVLTISPPNKQRRDLDNVFSSMKSAIDGVCSGLGIDDSQIRQVVLEWGSVSSAARSYLEVDLRECVLQAAYRGPAHNPALRGIDYYTGGRFQANGQVYVMTGYEVRLAPLDPEEVNLYRVRKRI